MFLKGNTTNTRERVFRRTSNTEKRVGTTLLSKVFLSELRGALILRWNSVSSQSFWFWNWDQISNWLNSLILALFNQRNVKPSSCFTFSVQSMLRQYGPSVPEELLHKLVNAFGELRSRADQGLISYPYSTREVVSVVKHLQVRLLLPLLFPGSLGPCTAQ